VSVPAYIGFDATAPESLHVGSLIQIMMLRWLQKTGHKPITLMGGGTTKVGDPSFRADERPLLTAAEIDENIAGIKTVFAYLDYGDGPSGALMLNNAEWLDGLNYLDFLRDIGRHFSVNRMLSFESVKSRLDREQSLSFLEFNYMILQAYDFLELNRRYGCRVQMGGSDQWGNIVNGVDLTRRVLDGDLRPDLAAADHVGRQEDGQTASGAVWLNADMLSSPYEFWQFWRNTTDADVGRFLKLYTELPLDECDRLGALEGSEINDAKIVLALCHGARRRRRGRGHGARPSSLAAPETICRRWRSRPRMSPAEGVSVAQLFVRSGLAKSGKEARRLIAEGGARIYLQVSAASSGPIQS
jgi:tyrosyl-tRNA synthetase